MRYRRTKLIPLSAYCPQTKHPLTAREMIQKAVQDESERLYTFKPQTAPKVVRAPLPPSVGISNFYKGIIKFTMQFCP